ncbi:ribonuclease h-like protein, partial [Stemphylium lycopersici]
MAQVVLTALKDFGISASPVGYFTLDNATNNHSAVAAIASEMGFITAHRRLRCAPHTLSLVGQMLLWGVNPDAYDNEEGNLR